MEFRDLKKQYDNLKPNMDKAINQVIESTHFISGKQVTSLEKNLAEYVGVKHCITCANGTDALSIALQCWEIGKGDAVFVPDFTFFSTAEVVAACGATPIFVDVDKDTFNIDIDDLENAIIKVINSGKLSARAIIPVDLFGQPADYINIRKIANRYNLKILEDGAQGFGGSIHNQKVCSFGDISTTSFFPAKPLGCYGDGGAIFTNDDIWAEKMHSICIHGKGLFKYDNIRIGMNSRLDTIQAAVLDVKLDAFKHYELENINKIAEYYTNGLRDLVNTPEVPDGFYSSWAQYVIKLSDKKTRNNLQEYLKSKEIPTMIYYPKPLHLQEAFAYLKEECNNLDHSIELTETVLALPIHPYMELDEVDLVVDEIRHFINKERL